MSLKSKQYLLVGSLVLNILVFIGIFIVYSETKQSYLKVGYHNGVLDEKYRIFNKIKKTIEQEKACNIKGLELEPILQVKTNALFLEKKNGVYDFCFR